MRLPLHAVPDGYSPSEPSEQRDGHLEIFTDNPDSSVENLRQANANLRELLVEKPNLEDLFLKLTGHGLRN